VSSKTLWIELDGTVRAKPPPEPQERTVWFLNGTVHLTRPADPLRITVKLERLTENQRRVVDRFLEGQDLDRHDKRTLDRAVWRLVHPEQWWRGRGRARLEKQRPGRGRTPRPGHHK
jgi:hypothetical protein